MAHSRDLQERLLYAVSFLRRDGQGGFGERGYKTSDVARWTPAQIERVKRAWLTRGHLVRFKVTSEQRAIARQRAREALEVYVQAQEAAGILPPRKRRRRVQIKARETIRRGAGFSAFGQLGTTPEERYYNAVEQLRSLRKGFSSQEGYGLKRPLTQTQTRHIRQAFNQTRKLLARSHVVLERSQMPKGSTLADWNRILRQERQRGGSEVWKKLIAPVPSHDQQNRPIKTRIIRLPSGRFGFEQFGVVKVFIDFHGRLLNSAEDPDDIQPYEIELFLRKEAAIRAPDATVFRLVLGMNEVFRPFRSLQSLAAEIYRILQNVTDSYGDPGELVRGMVAYTDTGPSETHVSPAYLYALKENDRRVILLRSKRFWAAHHRQVNAVARELGVYLRRRGKRPEDIEEAIAQRRIELYNAAYARVEKSKLYRDMESLLHEEEIYGNL